MIGPAGDAILQQHLASLKRQGATELELDDYVREWDASHQPHQVPAANLGRTLENGVRVADTPSGVAPRQESGFEHGLGIARAANKGLTAGFNDELSGLAGMGQAASAGGTGPVVGSLLDAYRKSRDAERANQATFADEHPIQNILAQGAGMLGPGEVSAGAMGAGKAGLGLLSRALRMAGVGGIMGGAQGAGDSEAPTAGGVLNDAIGGAKSGAKIGAALPLVAGALPTAARLMPGYRSRQLLQSLLKGQQDLQSALMPKAPGTIQEALAAARGFEAPTIPKGIPMRGAMPKIAETAPVPVVPPSPTPIPPSSHLPSDLGGMGMVPEPDPSMAAKLAANPPGPMHIEHVYNKVMKAHRAWDTGTWQQVIDGLGKEQTQRLMDLIQTRNPDGL